VKLYPYRRLEVASQKQERPRERRKTMHFPKTLNLFRATTLALGITLSGLSHAQLGSSVTTLASSSATVLHQASNGSSASWLESTDSNQIRIRQYVSSPVRSMP
jgi:hypothetical protein